MGPRTRDAGGGVAGERRLITILFCDLVGSTVLSQRLDQEDYAELVLTYQETLRGIIVGNGGIVANYLGDGVVGQFGYPDAHENDAERAVVSGLEICDAVAKLDRSLGVELGERIECRIGAHASVSVVGTMGTDRSDMSIFGDTANIASRVEGVAQSGQVVATSAVLDLLGGEYETADHQVVELKGVAEPTEVARIVGRAAVRLHDDRMLHLGRAEQLGDLAAAWSAAQEGHGSSITISAAGGMGKSALVRSLVNSFDEPALVIAKGRALWQAEPFGVLRQLAEGTSESASDPVKQAAAHVLDLLVQPLDHAISAEVRWQALFDAGMALLVAVTESPVIVIVEDLHWADASSRELLERFGRMVDERHGLLLVTTRPGEPSDGTRTIELAPMSSDHLRQLVVAYAHERLPDPVIDDIVSRAGGVPLFAVELARGARTDSNISVPESLQASLLSRMASRPDLSRVAQVASVLGDVIDTRLLAAVAEHNGALDNTLAELRAVNVLDVGDDGVWQFEHSLLREAIYSSMLRQDRRRLHFQVAERLTDDGARDDQRLSLVGHHLVLGARTLEGAGCYNTAARRTAALGAFSDSIELAERGIAALGVDPDPSEELLGLTMTKGNAVNAAIGYDGPGLFDLWCQAEVVAAAIGNRLEQSSGMNGQSVTALFDGDYDLAIERADRILRFGDEHADRVARLRAQCSRALPQLYSGRVADALASSEAAIGLYKDGDYELVTYGFGTDQLSIAQSTAAMAAFFAGDERIIDFNEAAIEHSRQIGSPISLAMTLNQAAMLAVLADDNDAAVRHVDEVWDVSDRYGLPFFRMVSTLTRAAALARLGDTQSRDLAYSALLSGGGDGKLGLTLGFFMIALCEEACGNPAVAFDLAAGALDVVEKRGERLLEVELLSLQMRCRPSDAIAAQLTGAVDAAARRGALGSAERGLALL